ncbi:hypothetical protein MFIFM68171_04701 [Madurella fahalii]|uniref:Molybdopterin cofactor biosynthesis C (MoaC) domain-containing protein n=1 Tax=Madurella fahalii TaxID=1157608 RepID=A0ABQ0G9P9_9PEZI
MVCVTSKVDSKRPTVAKCRMTFRSPRDAAADPGAAQQEGRRGRVVARVAGILAAQKTAELVLLCRPIA